MRNLKTLALQAKERLKGKQNVGFMSINGAVMEVKKISGVDEEFEERVMQIACNDCIENPISLLIDFEYYNSLEPSAKDKYFFEVVDKYKFFKEQYENSKNKIV